ncbi:hypothetical protein MLD52_18555 [Puniceicoccaceae bacterium K14]|nr:hypothetical protein [Puniceicoccaceae bacterium K14]
MKEQRIEGQDRLVNKISERSAKAELEERLTTEQVVLLTVDSTSIVLLGWQTTTING